MLLLVGLEVGGRGVLNRIDAGCQANTSALFLRQFSLFSS